MSAAREMDGQASCSGAHRSADDRETMAKKQRYAKSVTGARLQYRFGIGAGGTDWRHWHAVDLQLYGPPIVTAASARATGRGDQAFSVCGAPTEYAPQLGPFCCDSAFVAWQRCERCGWVVALNQGTVDQEIEFHVAAAGGGDSGLLRQIFTAILADLPPGRAAAAGHRSDLLAHAARHRPTVALCQDCSGSHSAAEVHGHGALVCPESVLVCRSCTFTAGGWAGQRAGATTGECVVAAPCSVLVALAAHYELAVGRPGESR